VYVFSIGFVMVLGSKTKSEEIMDGGVLGLKSESEEVMGGGVLGSKLEGEEVIGGRVLGLNQRVKRAWRVEFWS
jgi:hypothetical protein